jgi:putative Mn2+ efflux pump MntP
LAGIAKTVIVIFVLTVISAITGIKWGRHVGLKAGRRSGVIGGIILIAIGFKILVEHLEILS